MANSRITALIPIKARKHCKTRLSRHLVDEPRLQLVRSMLRHVLNTLEQIPRIDEIVVLSPERDEIPESVEMLQDRGDELNSSLGFAVAQLRQRGAEQVVIVPADLAVVRSADIESLLDAMESGAIVIAPSDDRKGTNALCLPVMLPFKFSFGENSFLLHHNEGARLGVSVQTVTSPGLGFDLDTRDDLELYSAHQTTGEQLLPFALKEASV